MYIWNGSIRIYVSSVFRHVTIALGSLCCVVAGKQIAFTDSECHTVRGFPLKMEGRTVPPLPPSDPRISQVPTQHSRSVARSVDFSNARMDLDPNDPHKQPERGDEMTQEENSSDANGTSSPTNNEHSEDQDEQTTCAQNPPRADVRSFSTSKDTDNNTIQNPKRKIIPGVVFLGGTRGGSELDTAVDVFDDTSDEPIVAQLSPDEADLEAMLTEKLSPKIRQEVEERLVHRIAQEVEERVRQRHGSIVVVAEAKGVPSDLSMQARKKWILAVFLLLVIGGVGFWILRRGTEDKNGARVEAETEGIPIGNPLVAPTASPSEPPSLNTVLLLDPLVEELQDWIAPSEKDLLPFLDPLSPQSQALAWLHDDPITLMPGRSTRTVLERYVLAVLYYSTSGPSWTYYRLNPADICTWNHASSVNDTDTDTESWYGVFCDNDGGSIEIINFYENNLRGRLPWEMVLLTNLEYIDFDWNDLTGSIPTRINELTRLEYFFAWNNLLTGSLPVSFAPLTLYIGVDDNMLTGPVPQTWGSSMPGLTTVHVDKNFLTGTLPTTFGQLVNLKGLGVSYNLMTGPIPTELRQLSSLERLLLVNNSFTGAVVCGVSESPFYVEADCEEVECPCCKQCCYDYVRGCTIIEELTSSPSVVPVGGT
jgi:Leucine rich repeat